MKEIVKILEKINSNLDMINVNLVIMNRHLFYVSGYRGGSEDFHHRTRMLERFSAIRAFNLSNDEIQKIGTHEDWNHYSELKDLKV